MMDPTHEPIRASPPASNTATFAGFLAATFCAVGIIGMVASYAAPLPYQRAMQREAVLDQLLATPPDQREALRTPLGDSADAVLAPAGANTSLAARVAAERLAMRQRFQTDAAFIAYRLRLLIVVVTVVGALFGAALLGLGRRHA